MTMAQPYNVQNSMFLQSVRFRFEVRFFWEDIENDRENVIFPLHQHSHVAFAIEGPTAEDPRCCAQAP